MVTITNRGPLQWRARVRRRGYPVISKTFETKVDAEAWARQMESEMDRGVFVSRAEAEQYTLSECLDRYIDEYTPRLKHGKREADRAKFLQQYSIAHRIMATIRSKDIADFRREREAEGVSGNTIRLDFALLSKLFNYARSDWGMESLQNPVELAAKPKPAKGRDRRLEEGEEEKLLKAAGEIFSPVILFALETAMRREEIASLQWKNVNTKKTLRLSAGNKEFGSAYRALIHCRSGYSGESSPARRAKFCFRGDLRADNRHHETHPRQSGFGEHTLSRPAP